MAAHYAVGHVAGKAVGRAEALAEQAASANGTLRDDRAILGTPTFQVDSSFGNEARFVLHVAQDTLSDFVPALLWLTLIIVLALLITWALTKLWGLLLRQCGSPENWLRLSQYFIGALLLFFGLTLAFGAVGVNFGQLFFGLSIIAAGAILSASDEIKNMTTGVKLASYRVLSKHHTIKVPAYSLYGELTDVGMFTSELRPIVERPPGQDDTYADETVLIENRYLMAGPLHVQWHDVRPSKRPPRFTATGAASMEHGSASTRFGSALDEESSEDSPTNPLVIMQRAANRRAAAASTVTRRLPHRSGGGSVPLNF